MKSILLAAVVSCILTGPMWAEKITVDPNTATTEAAETSADTGSEQMTRKISYEGGYKRLRAACQEIREMTSIRLSCGQTTSDWKVRDVPVMIYARDVPTGRLLAAIAACAHAQFSRLRVGEDKEDAGAYSILRTKKGLEAMAAPGDARRQADRERAKWAWDALTACANLPESAKPESVASDVWQNAKMVGSLLASLGTATRDKVLDGHIVWLGLENAAADRLYGALRERLLAGGDEPTGPQPDPARYYVKLVYSDDHAVGFEELKLYVAGFPGHDGGRLIRFTSFAKGVAGFQDTYFSGTCWVAGLSGLAQRLADAKVQGIPAPPARVIASPADQSNPGPPFVPLVTDEDWNLPEFKTKVTLSIPSDSRDTSFADVLAQVAKTGGVNIACEDFRTHKDPFYMRMRLDFGEDATVADVLRGIEGLRWFLDRKTMTLVGWERDWPERHALLVPERFISNLDTAMKGRGADVDDVVPLILLSRRQREEWIEKSREFSHIQMGEVTFPEMLWWLYDTLSPDQRRMAKSESALPLAALPPARLDEFAARLGRLYESLIPLRLDEESEPGVNFLKALEGLRVPTDAVLKIRSRPTKRLRVSVIESPERRFNTLLDAPPDVSKLNYAISLEGGSGESSYKLGGQWLDANFPILASDRKMMLDIVAARKK